ncbi:hypothetical protein E4T39_01505 [Aureobasidium subglaciale]|nr:hypothetical protein E4T39_01505 [Aureobasidium subglaciale]
MLATCHLSTAIDSAHERGVTGDNLKTRSEFSGFSIYEQERVDRTDLSAACKSALTQKIHCDDYIEEYGGDPSWRGYVDPEVTLYESVCDASCGDSIRSYFDVVSKDCAGLKVFGELSTERAGRFLEGWKETCYNDPDSGRNCNGWLTSISHHLELGSNCLTEIINEFSDTEDMDHMPIIIPQPLK